MLVLPHAEGLFSCAGDGRRPDPGAGESCGCLGLPALEQLVVAE